MRLATEASEALLQNDEALAADEGAGGVCNDS